LYKIDGRYSGKNILIISHGLPLVSLLATSTGMARSEILLLENWGTAFKTGEVRELPFIPYPHTPEYEFDVHRPYVDEVEFACSCDSGVMKRIPEVFDCWVESGSMPFAQFHYTGDDSTPEGKAFRSNFPADFISEGLDQTRGWFYTMLVMGAGIFGEAPYKNVIVNGMVLAEDGRKMSKRLKNYPDIADVVNKYGADAFRASLLFGIGEGGKVILAEDKARAMRNFANKICCKPESPLPRTKTVCLALTSITLCPLTTHASGSIIVPSS